MTPPPTDRGPPVNPGYARHQIARALATSETHPDPGTRERALERAERWELVLGQILRGGLAFGSRTPVRNTPAWATLEVVTGGFATGELLAGGPLRDHERALLERLGRPTRDEDRGALNAWFLTEDGLNELNERLRTGSYDVDVPEEGALLVVAWLAAHGDVEAAHALLDEIAPYFGRLRFYPIPLAEPRHYGTQVHVQDVGATRGDLERVRANRQVLAQKEAVEIWAPYHDSVVALFLETVEGGEPCCRCTDDWAQRARALVAEYRTLRDAHQLCRKPARPGGHQAVLRGLLAEAAGDPRSLATAQRARVRHILDRYLAKRGAPGSDRCASARARQRADVTAPTFHAIAQLVLARLSAHREDTGLDDATNPQQPVTPDEAADSGIPAGTPVPPTIRRKVERCLNDSVGALVERGVITSGETLARVLPQLTSGVRAAGIEDPALRELFAAIDRAFRRRRSLLLLDLERQVRIGELPWIAAIDRHRREDLPARDLARQTLEEIARLTISSFPHMLVPNKLLQELRALLKASALELPLTEEIAADIFMGEFSPRFVDAGVQASSLLEGTLYATYYGIDYEPIRALRAAEPPPRKRGSWRSRGNTEPFAALCAARAGVALGTWDPATNGMIIEQQQVITSHNLAALFVGLGLRETLGAELGSLARRCFAWICRRQTTKVDDGHARLVMLKNTAYAWRQMVFYLALSSGPEVEGFLAWARAHLDEQPADFSRRFGPALEGLGAAARGDAPRQRFLGWSTSRHWLDPRG